MQSIILTRAPAFSKINLTTDLRYDAKPSVSTYNAVLSILRVTLLNKASGLVGSPSSPQKLSYSPTRNLTKCLSLEARYFHLAALVA